MGYASTVVNSSDNKKYRISSINQKKKIPISSGDKTADKVLNLGTVDAKYEAAVYSGIVPFKRSLVALIEYWESYQREEMTLEEFHQLVIETVKSADIRTDIGSGLEVAFESKGVQANAMSWRQLFKAFKKTNIVVISMRSA